MIFIDYQSEVKRRIVRDNADASILDIIFGKPDYHTSCAARGVERCGMNNQRGDDHAAYYVNMSGC